MKFSARTERTWMDSRNQLSLEVGMELKEPAEKGRKMVPSRTL